MRIKMKVNSKEPFGEKKQGKIYDVDNRIGKYYLNRNLAVLVPSADPEKTLSSNKSEKTVDKETH